MENLLTVFFGIITGMFIYEAVQDYRDGRYIRMVIWLVFALNGFVLTFRSLI